MSDLINRLRTSEGIPDGDDDAAFRWYSEITDEAADKIERLQEELAAKQAEIDRLMLEFCPDEMTQEQLDEWGRNQRAVPEEELAALKQSVNVEVICEACDGSGHDRTDSNYGCAVCQGSGRMTKQFYTTPQPAQEPFDALENIRLFAARHRKEDWAATVLRFCAEGGAGGSPLRATSQPAQEPVAWLHSQRFESDVITDKVKHVWGGVAVGREAQYTIPLYRAPQPSAEVEEHAAMYRWIRENPQWVGFDSDYRPDEVDAAVMDAMQKGEWHE